MGVLVITTMGLLLIGLIYSSITSGELDILRGRLAEDTDDEDIYSGNDSVSSEYHRIVLYASRGE